MGSIPVRLVAGLRDSLGLNRAVETGTFQGDGAFELSRLFPCVITVELSGELHEAAKARLSDQANVAFELGDSRDRLPALVTRDFPSLYFLDGHWCEGPTSGCHDQCPVVGELEALASGHPDDCIIIDDAHFFLSAPPPPFDPEGWPSLVELVNTLQKTHPGHHVAVLNDQILVIPPRARTVLNELRHQTMREVLRRRVRTALGNRFRPWSPARQRLKRVRRRVAAAIQLSRW